MRPLVLFDFDGTLADTAPDLAASANRMRARHQLPELPYAQLRPYASKGARGLLQAGLGMAPEHPDYGYWRGEFLADYEAHMTELSGLFDGIPQLLAQLEAAGHAWGIVTNKMEYLALPMIAHLGLAERCAVAVGGDTTPYSKPHPAPLLHAADVAGYPPPHCLYVGDDERDIQAGKAAGMATLVAAYGYGAEAQNVTTWQADAVAPSIEDLWPAIRQWSQGLLQP